MRIVRIKNISKFARSIAIILGILILISLITNKSFSHAEVEYKTICVENGDTLWSIAEMELETNSYYKNKDIRYVINDIMDVNNLDSKTLMIDQQLKIPVM